MLLYLLIIIIFYFLITHSINKKESFKTNNCKNRHNAISRYPKNHHIDPLFDGKFKPTCCPSPYSNSSGCLCKDLNHTELIIMRGGNRIMC